MLSVFLEWYFCVLELGENLSYCCAEAVSFETVNLLVHIEGAVDSISKFSF